MSKAKLFDWDDLRVFHALVSTGSMSKAARRLSIVQPTVSRRLEALESRIGTRLVTRGADGIELTDTGERVWALVQTMQSTADDIERVASQADKAESGRVRILAPDGIASMWIARHLWQFVEANPLIKLEIYTEPGAQISEGDADIILQLNKSKKMQYVAHDIATLHYAPFTSRDYIDTYGIPDGLVDILNHRMGDLVMYTDNQSSWPQEIHAIKQMMKPSVLSDNSSVLFEALRSGAILSFIPTYCATLADNLVHLDFDLHIAMTLWMVYHPDQRRVTRVRKAIDWLRSLFESAQHPYFRRDYVAPAQFCEVETIRVDGERPKPRLLK